MNTESNNNSNVNSVIEDSVIPITVEAWKKANPNSRIRIRHWRFLLYNEQRRSPHFIRFVSKHPNSFLVQLSLIKKVGWQKDIFARGGKLDVEVTDSKGVTYLSSVECKLTDAYVKNEGIKLCLIDIYNQINKIVK